MKQMATNERFSYKIKIHLLYNANGKYNINGISNKKYKINGYINKKDVFMNFPLNNHLHKGCPTLSPKQV